MLKPVWEQVKVLWSQVRTLGMVLAHTFSKKDTVEYPDTEPYMFPRWRVRSIALPCRKPKMKKGAGILNFSVSIFPVASCVAFVRKPVLHMPSS